MLSHVVLCNIFMYINIYTYQYYFNLTCHIILCMYVLFCCVTSCHVMSCHVKSCHVISCCFMSWLLCYVFFDMSSMFCLVLSAMLCCFMLISCDVHVMFMPCLLLHSGCFWRLLGMLFPSPPAPKLDGGFCHRLQGGYMT